MREGGKHTQDKMILFLYPIQYSYTNCTNLEWRAKKYSPVFCKFFEYDKLLQVYTDLQIVLKIWDNYYHAEKSLNPPLTTAFLFFPTTAVPVSTAAAAADSVGTLLAFKYLPTPPLPTPVAPDSDVPAPGLLYHEPTLS